MFRYVVGVFRHVVGVFRYVAAAMIMVSGALIPFVFGLTTESSFHPKAF